MGNRNDVLYDNQGREITQDQEFTERSKERQEEDQRYVPVIIKRTDEAKVHPDDILERAIHEGVEQHKRGWLSLLLSAIAAGLILGFAAMAVAVVSQAVPPDVNPILQRLATAFVYPFGFIVCIISGTQLFTEHTATAVYPVLDKKTPISSLLRLWFLVASGNLLGTFCSAIIISLASDVVAANEGFIEIADHLFHFEFSALLISAILAGWLMAQGAWILLATPPQSSQILCIYIVTFLIGVGGLHHSIAGSAEAFIAVFISESFGIVSALRFVGIALLGNLIGGSVFVALLNYAHIRKTQ